MPTPLSTTQLDNLEAILADTNQTTDERAALYYQTLESYGYAYGAMAYGVVTNTGFSGKVANAFLEQHVRENNIAYNATIAADIRFELASADFTARINASGNDLCSVRSAYGFHPMAATRQCSGVT